MINNTKAVEKKSSAAFYVCFRKEHITIEVREQRRIIATRTHLAKEVQTKIKIDL